MQNNEFCNKKVSIIGTGYVGSGIAYALTLRNLASEIGLIDINQKLANAEMLDIRHGIADIGSTNIFCGDYSDIKDSDLIIITAGRNRRPNETRLDLIEDNIKIANDVAKNIEKYYNGGVVLVVSNPVDIITYSITKRLNLPKGKIFGTGCILDSSRFVNVISDYINLKPEFINALIIGEHGQSQIPLWSRVTVAQTPIETYCNNINLKFGEEEKNIIAQKVQNMGTEIISGKGKTYYGISTCVCHIASAILNRKSITASVTSCLDSEYGIKDIALSLPSVIDKNGVKNIVSVKLDDNEYEKLKNAATNVKNIIKKSGRTSVKI